MFYVRKTSVVEDRPFAAGDPPRWISNSEMLPPLASKNIKNCSQTCVEIASTKSSTNCPQKAPKLVNKCTKRQQVFQRRAVFGALWRPLGAPSDPQDRHEVQNEHPAGTGCPPGPPKYANLEPRGHPKRLPGLPKDKNITQNKESLLLKSYLRFALTLEGVGGTREAF